MIPRRGKEARKCQISREPGNQKNHAERKTSKTQIPALREGVKGEIDDRSIDWGVNTGLEKRGPDSPLMSRLAESMVCGFPLTYSITDGAAASFPPNNNKSALAKNGSDNL